MSEIGLKKGLLVAVLAVSSTIGATAGEREMKQDYLYHPVQDGIEIRNSDRRFNRPLYSTVERPHRLIALAGDRPEFMLMQISSTKSMDKLANLKLGRADGSWLDSIAPVVTRYDRGLQSYHVGAKGEGIEVAAVRAREFDGFLLRVKSYYMSAAPLVLAIGGRGKSNYDQNPEDAAFHPRECKGTRLSFVDNVLTLSGSGTTLFATAHVPLSFTAANPNQVAKGPQALLNATVDKDAVAVLSAEWPENREIFFILTPDAPDSKGVKAFRANGEEVFAQAVRDNQSLASTIEIDTPDPYLDAAVSAMVVGYEACWNQPSFRHGAIAWHDSYAGWRMAYGATCAGWHDRVQSHMEAFYRKQKEGRIPAKLENDNMYNMGEVLVDQALYDYEWTGDLKPLRNGGFDAIARHLAWGEKHVKTPDGLYENFYNAWNTDYKWCNGGGGTIASTYYWRANKTMAEIAGRLGKDPSVFKQRADEIATAMKDRLWSERVGVYGEYRDRLGLQLLHESPDLSSIYTPIDLGFCDPFESYRMLRFALRRFETVKGLPRGGALIYASEWLPNHYSTRDIYTAEIINTLLALYRIGQSEAAEPFRRAIDGSCFAGPGPGATGYVIKQDGTYRPHTDFSDVTSMYIRNVVEGVFGVDMDAPENRLTLQPGFPKEWKKASIQCPAVDYQYDWDGTTESMSITAQHKRKATVRLRARSSAVAEVTVDGRQVDYSIEPGIGFAWVIVHLPEASHSQLQVTYGNGDLPMAEFAETAAPGQTLTVRVDRGQIKQVRESGSVVTNAVIAEDRASCSISLQTEAGRPMYFILVAHRDIHFWVPVEVDVRPIESAAGPPARAEAPELKAQTVDLSHFRNQRLADLHKNTLSPRIKPFYWWKREGLRTVFPHGRIWWEEKKYKTLEKDPNTVKLTSARGRFVTDNGIPFAAPDEGKDCVFTSRYDNFPDSVKIPIDVKGRKICFLLAASITTAQSRMENARITVELADGTKRVLALRDPETIDDWLGSGKGKPYVLSGRPQTLGKGTHAVLQELDMGGEVDIRSVTLETLTNETMVGFLGITVMQELNQDVEAANMQSRTKH